MADNSAPEPKTDALQSRAGYEKAFGRYFMFALLATCGFVFFWMIRSFLVPVFLAAVFSGLFYGLYQRLLRRTRGRANLSAAMICLLLLLLLMIPTYLVADLVSGEAIRFYNSAEGVIQELIAQGNQGFASELAKNPIYHMLGLDKIDWQKSLGDVAKKTAEILAQVINKASKGTFSLIANLFLTLFAMFYFFRDGEKLVAFIKTYSPLDSRYEDLLIKRFLTVARATIKGTLFIGLIKGVLGGLTFWIFAIPSPILWAVVMTILSVIPMIGAWLVMYPAALILLLSGQIWQGITLFLIAALLIGNIDNVLQPRLVGREAGMHDLLIFLSTLGGIGLFGVMGFLIGPIISALFLTLLDVYAIELKVLGSGVQENPSP